MSGFTLVCLGALVGAPARYLMDRAIQARHQTVFPWGTMLVNIIGSFALGALTGLSTVHVVPSSVMLLIATGVCGAFTTYSAFAYETLRLIENRRGVHALANVTASVTAGLGAALIGYTVGSLL